MPRSPEYDFSKLEDQQKFEELPKKEKNEFIYNAREEALIEKIDKETYQSFFEDKINYPIHNKNYGDEKKSNPDAKEYIIKEGTLPALINEIWDHDNDLKSIENVIKYCYENKIYGKTLEKAIDMITSKKAISDSRIKKQGKREVDFWEIQHIISHFSKDMYESERYDLAKQLNIYIVENSTKLQDPRLAECDYAYVSAMYRIIKASGKNPMPFKDSGFDNEKFIQMLKSKKEEDTVCRFMKIKHFDETGELLSQKEIKEPKETTKGVYVDVDGTLVVGENQLNEKIVDELKKYKEQGKNIIIFTGGNVIAQEERLKRLGLEKEIGKFKVVSKGDFLNKKLEITIDDFSQEQLKNIFGIFSKEHKQV